MKTLLVLATFSLFVLAMPSLASAEHRDDTYEVTDRACSSSGTEPEQLWVAGYRDHHGDWIEGAWPTVPYVEPMSQAERVHLRIQRRHRRIQRRIERQARRQQRMARRHHREAMRVHARQQRRW